MRYFFTIFLISIVSLVTEAKGICNEKKINIELTEEHCWELRAKAELLKFPRPDKLLEILKIKPGTTVLEIGTGTGQRACKIAERLKGTGKIFVTDTNRNCIDYVTREARRRGINNLYPVLVKADGLDEFYYKHKYDVIFLYQVYFRIKDPHYFSKLRKLLTEEGHLFLFDYKTFNLNFSPEDLADFDGLVEALAQEQEDSPFFEGLQESTRNLIKQKTRSGISERLRHKIIDDFNSMLLNPYFHEDFLVNGTLKKEVSFSPEELDLVNFGLQYAKGMICFEETQKDKDTKEIRGRKKRFNRRRPIKILNKLLIIQKFRQYFQKGGIERYLSGGKWDLTKRTKKNMVMSGYKLEKEYDMFPFLFALDFVVNRDVDSCLFNFSE